MEPVEFITFRGKLLEAKLMWLGNQEILLAAIIYPKNMMS